MIIPRPERVAVSQALTGVETVAELTGGSMPEGGRRSVPA